MSSVKAELLSAIELKLKINLREFQGLHGQLSGRIRHSYDNNQHLLPILHNVINNNFKALEFILRFLDDKDIICVASTCQTLYRYHMHNSPDSSIHL